MQLRRNKQTQQKNAAGDTADFGVEQNRFAEGNHLPI
jgi:hypothetical protein